MVNQNEDQEAHPMETLIQYETLPLLSEDEHTNCEESTEPNPEAPLTGESRSLDIQSATDIVDIQPAVDMSAYDSAFEIMDCRDVKDSQNFQLEELHFEEKLLSTGGLVPSRSESSNKVAFVPVKVSRCSETDISEPNKKMKLDLCSSDLENDNPFQDLPIN